MSNDQTIQARKDNACPSFGHHFSQTVISTSLLAAFVFFPGLAVAQTAAPANTATETTGVQQKTAGPGPIVENWRFDHAAGSANVTIDPNGDWIFSGSLDANQPGKDLTIGYGLKSSTGAVYYFNYSADAAHGVQFTKTGQSQILAEDFATFGSHGSVWEYKLTETAAGEATLYKEREHKRLERENKLRELLNKEKEATERQDDKALARVKAELKKEERKERQEAQMALEREQNLTRLQQQQQQSGGGGSSVISDIGSALGSVASFVGGLF
jgi:hypothetical protein